MAPQNVGKVFLVGAGPGDPELMTKRGARLVQSADEIVVDDLVHPSLFIGAPGRITNVGKRGPGSPSGAFKKLSQSKINALLIRFARQGKRVVRLKGGDPFVFGRGGEEMQALQRAHVPFEIVPGVSSAIAAPALAGIPLTDRRWASQVTFVTGHGSEEPDFSSRPVRWSKFSPEGTLVVLMGVSKWPTIARELMSTGWPNKAPVAAIQSASTQDHRVLRADLGSSAKVFKQKRLSSPAIIVVGSVAALEEGWLFREKPLLGKTVVVTRALHQNKKLIEQLEDLGAIVIVLPTIVIEPLSGDMNVKGATQQLKGRNGYDWVVFLSENAVNTFSAATGIDGRWPSTARICAVGPRTAHAIKEKTWPVHRVAKDFHSRGVLKVLGSLRGKKILLPRVQGAPPDLSQTLQKAGASVDEIHTYRNLPAERPSDSMRSALVKGVDAILFTSASTVRNFCGYFTRNEIVKIFSRATPFSIGAMTSQALAANGIRRTLESKQATTSSMVEALKKTFAKRKSP